MSKNSTCGIHLRRNKSVVRMKENIWTEYYHIKCLEKAGFIRKIKKEKSGKWDKDDRKDDGTSNIVH